MRLASTRSSPIAWASIAGVATLLTVCGYALGIPGDPVRLLERLLAAFTD